MLCSFSQLDLKKIALLQPFKKYLIHCWIIYFPAYDGCSECYHVDPIAFDVELRLVDLYPHVHFDSWYQNQRAEMHFL